MQIIKKIYLLLFFILSVLTAVSCSDKTDDAPPFLNVSTKTVNLTAEPSQTEVSVSTNAPSWTATASSGSSGWMVLKTSDKSLSISVTENSDMNTRSGEILIKAGDLTEKIEVVQMGQSDEILVSSKIFTVSADGDDILLEVTSNIEYEIIIPGEALSWINPIEDTRSAGMVKKEFSFKVAWNISEDERRTELLIQQIDGSLTENVIVIQKGREGYTGGSGDDIADDIKVPVNSAEASSFQSGTNIDKSYDNDFSTIYHSSWSNKDSNYFPITLDYHFLDQEAIDYFIYHPRTEGSNGHFKEVEIWVSTKSEPTLKKVMDHDFMGSGSATKIEFDDPLIDPITIRFVVKSGAGDGQGFAACSEMEFYSKNPDNFDPLTLFTDITCSELKPGIAMEDINNVSNKLFRNIAFYLYNGTYPDEFRVQDFKAWPHPDEWARINKTSTLSLLDNPTGISVSNNDDLIVFVGETNGFPISLKVQNLDSPGGDGYNNASFYPLSTGINKLKVRNNGLVYLFYHTPDYETAPDIKVHFATGTVNGYFDSQKHQSSDWTRLLSEAKYKYFDVVGEYAHLTFQTEDFRKYAANNGPELIDSYDDLVRLEAEFMGLMKYNRPTINRAYFHVMYTSYMYATSYRTAYHVDTSSSILNVKTFRSTPWGPAHEMGHTFQTRPGFRWQGMTEVTNNVHSLYVQTQWGNNSRIESEDMGRFNNRYEKAYYNSFVNNTPHPGEEDVFCKLVSLWQLQLYFADARGNNDLYKDLYETVRTSPNKANAGEQQLEFVKMMCEVANADLTDFFIKWGYLSPYDEVIDDYGTARFVITQDQIDQTISEIKAKNYPALTEKIEYICDSNADVFKNRLKITKGTATASGTTINMIGWDNVVAYEVYQDNKLVFVSNKNSFVIDQFVNDKTKVLAIAYDGTSIVVDF